MSDKTFVEIVEQMAEAIREWNRAKREREEWKPVPGMVPPEKYLNNARKANVLLASALEDYETFISRPCRICNKPAEFHEDHDYVPPLSTSKGSHG